jgi:hypothetical protein
MSVLARRHREEDEHVRAALHQSMRAAVVLLIAVVLLAILYFSVILVLVR